MASFFARLDARRNAARAADPHDCVACGGRQVIVHVRGVYANLGCENDCGTLAATRELASALDLPWPEPERHDVDRGRSGRRRELRR